MTAFGAESVPANVAGASTSPARRLKAVAYTRQEPTAAEREQGANDVLYEVQMLSNTAALLEDDGRWTWGSLVAHSDAGSQYTSFDYTQLLDDHDVIASIGSVGDAYDNAAAESFVDSFKTELIADRSWTTRSQLELAVLEYVAWFNNERLHEALDDRPPREVEELYAAKDRATTDTPRVSQIGSTPKRSRCSSMNALTSDGVDRARPRKTRWRPSGSRSLGAAAQPHDARI